MQSLKRTAGSAARRTFACTLVASLLACGSGGGAGAPGGDGAGGARDPSAGSDGAALNLPIVPWDGGPSYYDKFPQAKAMGWTDSSYFPVAGWGLAVGTQADVDFYKSLDFNVALELYASPFPPTLLPLLRANGISAIHGYTSAPNIGNETVGWLLPDEPEQHDPSPFHSGLLAMLQGWAGTFPSDGRLRYTNFTTDMVWRLGTPGDAVTAQWIEVSDVVSLDTYWYSWDLPCAGTTGGEVWPDGSGAPQPHGSAHNALSGPECQRAHNYGRMVKEQLALAHAHGKKEPVWAFIEVGSPGTLGNPRAIQPDQLGGAVWASLIAGARGIAYFPQSFTPGPCLAGDSLRHPCYAGQRDKVKEVNARIRQLAPVLNTPSYQHTFNDKLDTMLKAQGGAYYIFAMATAVKGGSALGTHTLQLPAGLAGSTVDVLYEGRTLAVDAGRRFTDTFSAEHEVHIYRIRP